MWIKNCPVVGGSCYIIQALEALQLERNISNEHPCSVTCHKLFVVLNGVSPCTAIVSPADLKTKMKLAFEIVGYKSKFENQLRIVVTLPNLWWFNDGTVIQCRIISWFVQSLSVFTWRFRILRRLYPVRSFFMYFDRSYDSYSRRHCSTRGNGGFRKWCNACALFQFLHQNPFWKAGNALLKKVWTMKNVVHSLFRYMFDNETSNIARICICPLALSFWDQIDCFWTPNVIYTSFNLLYATTGLAMSLIWTIHRTRKHLSPSCFREGATCAIEKLDMGNIFRLCWERSNVE